MSTRAVKAAFTLVELLVSLSVVGMLLAILLVSVQGVRESARRTTCANRIRSLGHAVLAYEAANMHFPAGILGHEGVIHFPNYMNDDHDNSWRKQPFTSAIALSLRYSDDSQLLDRVHPAAFNERRALPSYQPPFAWFGEIPGLAELSQLQLPALLCPSDAVHAQDVPWIFAALQPVLHEGVGATAWVDLRAEYSYNGEPRVASPGITNYVVSTGVGAGVPRPGSSNRLGIFSAARDVRAKSVIDGMAYTVMLGEQLGTIDEPPERFVMQSWLHGGLGRGWVSEEIWEAKLVPLIGNPRDAHITGFSSSHKNGAFFVFADGHTEFINANVDSSRFFSALAMADNGAWGAD